MGGGARYYAYTSNNKTIISTPLPLRQFVSAAAQRSVLVHRCRVSPSFIVQVQDMTVKGFAITLYHDHLHHFKTTAFKNSSGSSSSASACSCACWRCTALHKHFFWCRVQSHIHAEERQHWPLLPMDRVLFAVCMALGWLSVAVSYVMMNAGDTLQSFLCHLQYSFKSKDAPPKLPTATKQSEILLIVFFSLWFLCWLREGSRSKEQVDMQQEAAAKSSSSTSVSSSSHSVAVRVWVHQRKTCSGS